MEAGNDAQAGSEQPPVSHVSGHQKDVGRLTIFTFLWALMGCSIIYGIRVWHDAPINPQFGPIVFGLFASLISLTLVYALQNIVGPIEIRLGEHRSFTGASGPLVMWCLCFVVVCYGLYLLGAGDVVKANPQVNYIGCSTGDLLANECAMARMAAAPAASVVADGK